mgnify:CR=1 FL=1
MPSNPPITAVKTSHALTIQTGTGKVIGMIQNWSPQMSRQITPIFELNLATSGEPRENVPGNLSNLTVQVSRYDIYTNLMERAFGTRDLIMLSNQNEPFVVNEMWRNPKNELEVISYWGCWFNNIGRTLQSTNDRIVQVSAGLTYCGKNRMQ